MWIFKIGGSWIKNPKLDELATLFNKFKDEKIVVLPPKDKPKSMSRTKVQIQIITSSKTYPGVYSMYLDENNEWKIINIVVNGINLGLTFRSQFYSLMEKNNNDISKVIDKWITSV